MSTFSKRLDRLEARTVPPGPDPGRGDRSRALIAERLRRLPPEELAEKLVKLRAKVAACRRES